MADGLVVSLMPPDVVISTGHGMMEAASRAEPIFVRGESQSHDPVPVRPGSVILAPAQDRLRDFPCAGGSGF